jgi:hypothetical protein
MKKVCMLLAGVILMASGALAQGPETALPPLPPPGAAGGMVFFQSGGAEPNGKVFTSSYNYVYTTNMGEREAVKGAPYSATAVTESTQVLADGNRIVNKSSTFLARDGEGRTRREMPKGLGPLPVDMPRMVMISYPDRKTEYMKNHKKKTADVIKRVEGKGVFVYQTGKEQRERQEIEQKIKIKTNAESAGAFHVETGGEVKHVEFGGEVKHEDLGPQVIQGISCTGTREIRTIPAGAIGNEQPIEITSETWMSPELKTVILSKHRDPRFGETVYQLTDLKRDEPNQALFQVPSDYRIIGQDVVASPKE